MALWGFVQISKFYRVTVSPYSTHHHRNISSQQGQDVLFLGCCRISSPYFQKLHVARGHALSPLEQQRRLRNSLGPGYAVGEKSKKRGQIEKRSASEASLDTSRGLLRSLIIFALPSSRQATKTSVKKCFRAALNLIALIPSHAIRQM